MQDFLRITKYWTNYFIIRVLLWRRIQPMVDLISLGNPGASWKIPRSLLLKNATCYCAGVGEDISFERKLSSIIPVEIHLFDPTPRSIQFIASQRLPKKMHFHSWGLWSHNSRQKFFVPSVEKFVSHSIVNLHNTKEFFVADCKSLTWMMNKLGHKTIDLLKIDIEGAEYEVLQQLLKTKVRPRILLVEFDQPMPVGKTFRMIQQLLRSGFVLHDQTGWNFLFTYDNER